MGILINADVVVPLDEIRDQHAAEDRKGREEYHQAAQPYTSHRQQ